MTRKLLRPAEAYDIVFDLARIGASYLAAQHELSDNQRKLREAGNRALSFFDNNRRRVEQEKNRCCSHCGERNFNHRDDYMVSADVWRQAHPEGYRGLLHLKCLQERLGRALRTSDFTYSVSFVNRHLFDVTLDDWETHIGRKIGAGLVVRLNNQNKHATSADFAHIQAIKDRA